LQQFLYNTQLGASRIVEKIMEKINTDQLTGKVAIGAIFVLSFAVMAEEYVVPYSRWLTSTDIWGLYIAIPFLFFCYFTGYISGKISSVVFIFFRKETSLQLVQEMINIGSSQNEIITGKYRKHDEDVELLQATCPALLTLAITILLNLWKEPYLAWIFILAAGILFVFFGVCLYLISRMRTEMKIMSSQITGSAKDELPKQRKTQNKKS
jgi:hypothetical protein